MDNIKLCKDVLINVNKVVVRRCDIQKYIKFSKKLDSRIRCKYGKYYICDQVNQDKKRPNVFYVEAFYRDIPGVYEASKEINDFVEASYYYEFGNCIERISITTFRDVEKVYPTFREECDEKKECDCKCDFECKEYEQEKAE